MFGVSFEHLLIVGVILLLVGPKRLPELGNTMGKAIKNFKDSFSGIEEATFKRVEPPKQEEKIGQAKAEAAEPPRQDASVQNKSDSPANPPPAPPA